MLLWICFAVLTAAVVLHVLQPLRGNAEATALDPTTADRAVYRDQLRELEAERDRGLVTPDEFESARAEIARRLLAIGDATTKAPSDAAPVKAMPLGNKLTYVLAALIPAVSIATYSQRDLRGFQRNPSRRASRSRPSTRPLRKSSPKSNASSPSTRTTARAGK